MPQEVRSPREALSTPAGRRTVGVPDVDRQDRGLECPKCMYNLTGLTVNRCPECGEAFDPAELARLASDEITPATPWDSKIGIGGFVTTWLMAIRRPRELAEGFPARHSGKAAVGFSALCYVLAVGALVGGVAILPGTNRDPQVHMAVAIGLGAVAAGWACETVTAVAMALLIHPTRARRRYHFWRGITHYMSSYFILSGFWGAATLFVAETTLFDRPQRELLNVFVLFPSATAIFLYWSTGVCRAGLQRSNPGVRRWLSFPIVIAIGIGSMYFGVFTTFLAWMLVASASGVSVLDW